MLLTARDWQWWFGVSGAEAARLVRVQRALLQAGIDPCPETVLGMSRTVLADGLASQRLRALADLWDPAPAALVAARPGWPIAEEALAPHHHAHLNAVISDGRLHRCRRQRRSRS